MSLIKEINSRSTACNERNLIRFRIGHFFTIQHGRTSPMNLDVIISPENVKSKKTY